MKRQPITNRHAEILRGIRDRHKERLKNQTYNRNGGYVGQASERVAKNPRLMDDLTTLLELFDEINQI